MHSTKMDDPLECDQELPVFFFRADGHPNHTPLNVANDDALPQQSLKYRATVSPNIDINKISLARDRRKLERDHSLDHLFHSGCVDRSTPRHMFVVAKSGKRGALCE